VARCSSTNLLESEELAQEGEEQELNVDEGGHVNASVRLVKECAGCSQEIKEVTFELEGDLDATDLAEHEGHSFSANCDTWEVTDRTQNTIARGKSKGKRITRSRYMKRMVGVTGEVVVTCDDCDDAEVGRITLADECQASMMEGEQSH
jgi:hypothetical protein